MAVQIADSEFPSNIDLPQLFPSIVFSQVHYTLADLASALGRLPG
jgi:hypothetical protein